MRKILFLFILCMSVITAIAGGGYEIPLYAADSMNVEVRHTGYSLSYNTQHCNPDWVAWMLTEEMTRGDIHRSNYFHTDHSLPWQFRVQASEYTGSGYDRGHMCPAADMQWSSEAMYDCFNMSNMCPQNPKLNRISWKKLENACRKWAKKEDTIYIVCGPYYSPERVNGYISQHGQHRVDIPEGFFKAVLSMRKGNEKAIGFFYSNDKYRQSIKDTAMSVDKLEEITGMDFFHNLPDSVEERLESNFSLADW